MNKFIELTNVVVASYSSSSPFLSRIHLNVHHISSIREATATHYASRVNMINNVEYCVKETIEEIQKIIHD